RRAGSWTVALRDPESGESQDVRVTSSGAGTQRFANALAAASGIHVVLDTPRAVKASIGPAGGTLQAIAANGTKLILIVPARSLAFAETITLTPIKSVQRLPFTSLAAGVEIGPAGLRFGIAARLAIQPVAAVPLPQESTFAYRSAGAQ